MIELGGLLTAGGGVCEFAGLVLVVREIHEDRQHARSVLTPRPPRPRAPRRYPGKTSAGLARLSPFESMQTPAARQLQTRQSIRRLEADAYNAFIEMRRQLDAQLDQAVDTLRDESRTADNDLRRHLLYLLAGSIRLRVIGATLLGVGIVLEIAGALLGAFGA